MLFSALKGRGSLTVLAQEFALDLGNCEYMPSFADHINGVANVIADMLSRSNDPKKEWQLPSQLANVKRKTLAI